jgi:hypothetical protein
MRFSVGMALYSDPNCPTEEIRAAFTVMSLLTHHPLVGEVIVVDNHPQPTPAIAHLLAKTGRGVYVPMPAPVGTAAPRNRVFEVARFNHVACLDSHVLLHPGFFEAIEAFYDAEGDDCPDLLHGPLMGESGQLVATHMNDQWRKDMWGTWGRAWARREGGELFSVLTRDDLSLEYVSLDGGEQRTLSAGEVRGMELPLVLAWPGHEHALRLLGCVQPSKNYEVPGHGMGFFASRKDAWLPFHPQARGFGGEEMTTGYRFRQAGRRVWTVSGAKWWHDFGRRGGPVYPLVLYERVRNYALECKRLGLDLAVLRAAFPPSRIAESEWQQAIAGAEWPKPGADVTPGTHAADRDAANQRRIEQAQAAQARARATAGPQPKVIRGIGEFLSAVSQDKRAAGMDLATLRALATGRNVLQIGTDGGTAFDTIALLAGSPRKLTVVVAPGTSPRAEMLRGMAPANVEYEIVPEPKGDSYDLVYLGYDDAKQASSDLGQHAMQAGFVAIKSSLAAGIGPGHLIRTIWTKVALPGDNRLTLLRSDDQPEPTGIAEPAPIAAMPVTDPAPSATPAKEPPQVPAEGPGTELKKILASLGVNPSPSCDCNGKAAQMNIWGVKFCRANLETIVGWMKDGAPRWKWTDKVWAASRAVATGLAFKLDLGDPFRSIVVEAIRRAEANAAAAA